MTGTIADVRCRSCGAPARFNILKQQYCCSYCGGQVGIAEALSQKQGFRSIQRERIKRSALECRLLHAACTGCGAELVFEESEAMTNCAFCGRALVRTDYLSSEELPELIIPFRISREEAVFCLDDWCRKNAHTAEAKHLKHHTDGLEGFYLPYELVRGPVSCSVSRMDAARVYHCNGYVDNVFVNCSKQLDNRLLDGVEPFELEDLRELDFRYAAGQRIKIGDINSKELIRRVSSEVSADYAPVVRKTLETKAVEVDTNSENVLRLPVLLPIYYIRSDKVIAAVNGQTGKVSVRAEKPSHYYFLPWWLKAILSTLLISAAAFAAFWLFGMELRESLIVSAMLALVTLTITLVAFSDTIKNEFRVETEHKIYTSSGGPLRRMNGRLVRDTAEIKKEVVAPSFIEELDGKPEHVKLVFSSPLRRIKMAFLALLALFLPVIVALFINGFDFTRLTLGGSAVWFCIMVPVVPIYLLKFGVIDLYQNPWIYIIREDGSRHRYRNRRAHASPREIIGAILKLLFVPPICFAVWFGIVCFCIMCYLTAFGFD